MQNLEYDIIWVEIYFSKGELSQKKANIFGIEYFVEKNFLIHDFILFCKLDGNSWEIIDKLQYKHHDDPIIDLTVKKHFKENFISNYTKELK